MGIEGTKPEDRGPLFPGSSCFPLSPDHKHKTDYKYHTRGKHDQLNMIFNLIGSPTDKEAEELSREDARRYLSCFAKREGDGVESKFPHVKSQEKSADIFDLLKRMLLFAPKGRIPVDRALSHDL